MATGITDAQIDEIAHRVAAIMSAQQIPDCLHDAQHEWVKMRMQDEADMRAFRKRVIEAAIIYVIPLALGFVCFALWRTIRAAILDGDFS